MCLVYLDTNVVVRLMQGDRRHITRSARQLINRAEIFISPMVILEIEYLYETTRTRLAWQVVEAKLSAEIGLKVCDLPFDLVSRSAVNEKWTRDPFDRMIVAQAKSNGLAQLISSDELIAKHYPRVVW